MYKYSSILILAVFVVYFTGCDFSDEYRDQNMVIETAYPVSISGGRPTEVVIGAIGYGGGCDKLDAQVSAVRAGNKIHLTARMEAYIGYGACEDIMSEVYGEVTVKDLEVGEYIIMSEAKERGRFRIESDAAYVDVNPTLPHGPLSELDSASYSVVRDNGELDDTAYRVTIVIDIFELIYKTNCETVFKTEIDRWGKAINLDIWHMVQNTDSRCTLLGRVEWKHYEKGEIDIGTFSPGKYALHIKDKQYYFHVPHPIDEGDALQ